MSNMKRGQNFVPAFGTGPALTCERAAKTSLLDLPIEILDAIVGCLAPPAVGHEVDSLAQWGEFSDNGRDNEADICVSREALSNLSQTCKSLDALAMPRLYGCLLDPSYNGKRIASILSSVTDNNALLEHTRYLRITHAGIDVLLHARTLQGLVWDLSERLRLGAGVLQSTLEGLSRLTHLRLIGNGKMNQSNLAILQELHRLPNLYALSLTTMYNNYSLQAGPGSQSLRQLYMDFCGDSITDWLLRGLASCHLEYLELFDSACERLQIQLAPDCEVFTSLHHLELRFCEGLVVSSYISSFQSLTNIGIGCRYLGNEDLRDILQGLPPSVAELEIIAIDGIESFGPLCFWLQHSGTRHAGLRIALDLTQDDERLLSPAEYQALIERASRAVELAEKYDIFIEFRELPEEAMIGAVKVQYGDGAA